jgi:hypothetical protein
MIASTIRGLRSNSTVNAGNTLRTKGCEMRGAARGAAGIGGLPLSTGRQRVSGARLRSVPGNRLQCRCMSRLRPLRQTNTIFRTRVRN